MSKIGGMLEIESLNWNESWRDIFKLNDIAG